MTSKNNLSDEQKAVLEDFNKGKNIYICGEAGCVDKETEFLTPTGWKYISDYVREDKVATYNAETDTIKWEIPKDYVKLPETDLTLVQAKGLDMCLSGEHRVLYWPTKTSKPKTISFNEVKKRHEKSKDGWSGKIKTTFKVNREGLNISEGELRLQVAVMADGNIVREGKDNYCQMRFSKKREYERLLELCKTFNLKYDDKKQNNQNQYEVIVWPKWEDKKFDSKYWNCSQEQLEIIKDEICYWDGNFYNKMIRYFSVYKENADFVQYLFSACGLNTCIHFDTREDKPCYTVRGTKTGNGFRCILNKDSKLSFIPYKPLDGFKYCFTVSTSYWVARRNGKIFLTGNTGKSTLITEIVDFNYEREKPLNLAIVAPTGKAALNIGGSTIHRFFGFPTTVLDYSIVYNSLKNEEIIEKLNALDILIIEEISMVRIDLFAAIDIALKETRNNRDEPFGGVQLIVVGDFNQLPPVVTFREKEIFSKNRFCFYSNEWHNAGLVTHCLTKSFRQGLDIEYSESLNRLKKNDKKVLNYFNENCSRKCPDTAIIITTTNKNADFINNKSLSKIKSPSRTFSASYSGEVKDYDFPINTKLEFKEGCRVVSCVNLTPKVCNGSLGTIKKINSNKILVHFDCGEELDIRPNTWFIREYKVKEDSFSYTTIGEFTQIPLKLGYAMTIHKCQGMTIDSLHVDLGRGCFEHGQLYVALSRCRNISQLSLARPIYRSDLIVDPKIERFLTKQNLL